MITKQNLTIGIVFLLLLVGSFFLGKYSNDNIKFKKVLVNIPAVSGKSDTIKTFIPLPSKGKDTIIYKNKIITSQNPFNEKLAKDYIDLEQRYSGIELEAERLQKYVDANQIREYSVPFEDSLVKITGNLKTQGELLSIQYDYNLKSRQIAMDVKLPKPKERIFSLNIGTGLTTTKQLNKIDPSIIINLAGKKNILSASYSIQGVIGVNYSVNLFNIKK